jgi:hypothetical protein
MLCLSIYGIKLLCSDFIGAMVLLVRPLTIACANAITSDSVLGNLAILKILLAVLRTWRSRSIKSYIPFSPVWCPQISQIFWISIGANFRHGFLQD